MKKSWILIFAFSLYSTALIRYCQARGTESAIELHYGIQQIYPTMRQLGELTILAIPHKRVKFTLTGSSFVAGASGRTVLFLDRQYGIEVRGPKNGVPPGSAFIDDGESPQGFTRIPYLPGNWLPIATSKVVDGEPWARIPMSWVFAKARIEGSNDQPSRVLQGCFPNLPDSKATVSYEYTDWKNVAGINIPGGITFRGYRMHLIGLVWTLTSTRVVPASELPATFYERCARVYDNRLIAAGAKGSGTIATPATFKPIELTAYAKRDDLLLKTLPPVNYSKSIYPNSFETAVAYLIYVCFFGGIAVGIGFAIRRIIKK